ncbi:MAG TPA: HAD family hydrolase [Mucilaginibacter sp.]|nr:HAD family hydrolase [Mucilaginibacter sp.]
MSLKTGALIFDLDGTLWDASASCAMAWNKALEKAGINHFHITREMTYDFAGKLLDDIFSQYFTFLQPGEYAAMASAYAKQEAYHMKVFGGSIYPGVKAELKSLRKRYPLYIVSNCLAGYIENFLELHDLGSLFCDFECSGVTGKPKAENIKALMARNNLYDAVYIGDTAGDADAAQRNHIPFIYASYGFGKVLASDHIIHDFKELKMLLDHSLSA